jgi:regulator of cell morphogenesis and NO signaling
MTNATLNIHTPVGQLAAERPEALPILERLGLDYCCGGDRTIDEACRQAKVDPRDLLDQLDRALPVAKADATDWLAASLTELCDHIEQTHHAFLREQLPLLADLVTKVVAAHGDNDPELHQVRETFLALKAELEPHLFKEERILFPAVRLMEAAPSAPAFPFGTVQNPINVMQHEHDVAGAALARLRDLTDGFRPPCDACSAYRALLESLERLEADLHQHIHKENNILFPRAIELERGSRKKM